MENIFADNYNHQDDIILIKEATSGSSRSLEKLIRRHYNFIYNVALRFVLNPDDAEDLTQDVLMKAIRKLDQFQFDSQFRTWLYRIVFNHFLNMNKKKMENVVGSFDDYAQGLDSIPFQELNQQEEIELKDKIEDAKIGCMSGMILCLSREQRIVFILGEYFSSDSNTGASILGMKPDNFRKILSRSRKDLYNFMNQKCGLINLDNPCRCPKKTKGFIEAGWVNANNLQFNNHYITKIANIVQSKSEACDNVMEEKYGILFKDHPYYDKDKSKQLISQLKDDPLIIEIFDL